tara:strand:- start:1705 stop:2097 length:393 start_codon:yes stop_codon:yes gene_type:complete
MKYYAEARVRHMCVPCVQEDEPEFIEIGEPYIGDSTRAFCVKHGKLVMKGELLFDNRTKKYMSLQAKKDLEDAEILEEPEDEPEGEISDEDAYCQCDEPVPDDLDSLAPACDKCDRAISVEVVAKLKKNG